MSNDPQKLLEPYLLGEQPREDGEWDMFCPLHDDTNRSAQINFEKGVWYCHKEEMGGSVEDLIDQKDEWLAPPTGRKAKARRASRVLDLPSEAEIAGWKVALQGDPIALDDLKVSRGIWTKTADFYDIGWDKGASAYTIPVRDDAGKLLNLRRYQLHPPPGRRKIWGVEGHNEIRLFPLRAVQKATDEIIVCEGEWDAIVTNQYGFRAVTRTGSAGSWSQEWSRYFEDKIVYVCHDADNAGQVANRKVARKLAAVAREVRIVRLPYPITPDHGKDLTDWWLDHDNDREAFRRLLDEARPFDEADQEDPEEIGPTAAAVTDAFDSRKTGRPLQLTVTVKGKRAPGYTVPRKVEFRCTQDLGTKCEVCPMKARSGEHDEVIAGSDPLILELMDSTKPQITEVLRRVQNIPKCPKLNINIRESQAVEILYARPSVEQANGGGAADYTNIKLTSVGRHDTSPNQTVRVVGALHPDPRKQLNEFLTWDVSKMETSLDRFEMDRETYRALQVFQPDEGQQPLAKLREIADDLAQHVTFIYGRPELHAAMDLVYHSSTGFSFAGKQLQRGWMELLVVGETRTGKSEVATRMGQHYAAGEVISCESATLAGVLGGLQQFGSNKEWAVTWGAIPINDRRLVVLDEISGLHPEDIAQLSSVRSSGIAELAKIQQERTYARTRLIWLGNPRSGRMSDFTYGVQHLRPLIGNNEDIARFDLAMSVASGDVSADEINRVHAASGAPVFSRTASQLLLRWVWSRTHEQVVWAEGAEEAVYKASMDLGRRYTEDPPLIQAANVREKVARLAVAIAGRLFSTDERGDKIIVKRSHVRAAVKFIDRLYSMPGFGYAERSKDALDRERRAEKNVPLARKLFKNKPLLAPFLREQGKFRRQDLEEILDLEREEANAIISTLMGYGLIYKDKGDTRLTPTMNRLLREVP